MYSSSITSEDVISQAKELNDKFNDSGLEETLPYEETEDATLAHAAAILHATLKDARGLEYRDLATHDLSLTRAEEMVPKKVTTFLHQALTGRCHGEETTANEDSLHRRVLSIGQDMVFAASQGKQNCPNTWDLESLCGTSQVPRN